MQCKNLEPLFYLYILIRKLEYLLKCANKHGIETHCWISLPTSFVQIDNALSVVIHIAL